jgi:hypothetical protein
MALNLDPPDETIEPIRDYFRRALLGLPPTLWGKPRLGAVLRAHAEQAQELENVFWDILVLRTLDYGDLPRLKLLGTLIGQVYTGEVVEDYRGLLRAKARANRSSGTLDDLLEVFAKFYATTDITEPAEATVKLQGEDATGLPIERRNAIMRDAKAAGVAIEYMVAEGTGLRWDDANASTAATGGWGDSTDSNVGGATWSYEL